MDIVPYKAGGHKVNNIIESRAKLTSALPGEFGAKPETAIDCHCTATYFISYEKHKNNKRTKYIIFDLLYIFQKNFLISWRLLA